MRYALALGAAALLLSPCSTLANGIGPIRPIQPQPGVGQGPRLVIEVDPKAKVARLIVPRQFLNKAPAQPRRFGQLPTIMVGVALAMSLAFSGLWLVRKRGVPGVKPLLLIVALLGIGGGALWADIAPRRPPVQQPGQPFPGLPQGQIIAAFQPIQVETPARGNVIKLIIPAQQGGVGAPAVPAQPFGPRQGGGFE
jgi:hypothetical protein